MTELLPADVELNLDGLRQTGDGWIAKCPAHADNNPSLSLTMRDGKLLAHCHAGCEQMAVLDAIGYQPAAKSTAEWTPRGDAVAVYDYVDEQGHLLFQVLRTADKQFPQRQPDPSSKSGWKWSLGDTRRVPFRLPQLIQGVRDGATVYITEGEKDALALISHGKVATCNPGGAGKWRVEYAEHLRDATVIVCADKDEPGRKHGRAVAATLEGIAARVWIVEAADPHKDVAAHLGAGLALTDLRVTNQSDEPAKPELAIDVLDLLNSKDPDYDWLVPGLIERRDRFILTGFEGLGKTVWLRQMAVLFAAGINPVTWQPEKPLRVLFIDAENTERQNRRNYRRLVDQAARQNHPVQRGQLFLEIVPDGKNLPDADDGAWLAERVTAHKPDVLFIGPLYNLHTGSPNDEQVIRRLVGAINNARNKVDCAVFMEAHAGHANGKDNERSVRPTGSSLYLRWPEFGFGLRGAVDAEGLPYDDPETGRPIVAELKPWRGARDERAWPKLWQWGDAWPWEPTNPEAVSRDFGRSMHKGPQPGLRAIR